MKRFLILCVLVPSIAFADLEFPGSGNSYVDLGTGNVGARLNGTSSITVAVWVKPDATTTGRVITVYRDGSTEGLTLGFSSGNIVITYPCVVGTLTGTGIAPANGEWHHIAARYLLGGEQAFIYVDGVQRASGSDTCGGTWTQGAPSVSDYIGAQNTTSLLYDGRLADLRVYALDIGVAQIESLAKSNVRLANFRDPVKYWRFDEGIEGATGGTTMDLIQITNGTLGSAVIWRDSQWLSYP